MVTRIKNAWCACWVRAVRALGTYGHLYLRAYGARDGRTRQQAAGGLIAHVFVLDVMYIVGIAAGFLRVLCSCVTLCVFQLRVMRVVRALCCFATRWWCGCCGNAK